MGPTVSAALTSPTLALDASPVDVRDTTAAPIRSLATSQFAALPPGTVLFPTKAACELWANKENIDTAVMAQINQPFGKDCLAQSFTVAAAFRHVLCPVIKSGFFAIRTLLLSRRLIPLRLGSRNCCTRMPWLIFASSRSCPSAFRFGLHDPPLLVHVHCVVAPLLSLCSCCSRPLDGWHTHWGPSRPPPHFVHFGERPSRR
jgi:hypothetical protein